VRVLVTGGAGFIGRHIVEQLLADGHDVLVVDVLHPAAHHAVPTGLQRAVEHRWADLADPAVARAAVTGIDAVCHQASMVGLGVSFADVAAYVHHNDIATASLLGALHDTDFEGRIVLASSMVVYGEGCYRCAEHGAVRPGPRPEARLAAELYEVPCPRCGGDLDWDLVDEEAPLDPRNVYAATKVHQEHLLHAFEREHPGTSAIALRYHNVYGPGMPQDTPYAGVASIFRSAIERGERPRVFEDGDQLRDFVHVHDVARANLLALGAPVDVRGPFNVASGRPHTLLQMATALAQPSGATPEVVGGYRLGDVRHVVASSARADAQLHFQAEVTFEDGMRQFASAPMRGAPA
jgi:dTDP-L-rhamnose 4-epimerase